jgi:AcrR family transcriptional regulator
MAGQHRHHHEDGGVMPRGSTATTGSSEVAGNDDSTRTRILHAALECFMQLGISRTSLHDVARHAQVSRGTVYRYFSERQELIDATIELRGQRYYQEAASKMDVHDTLAEQMGAFGEIVGKNVADFTRHRLRHDESMFMRLSASDRDGALRRMSHFLVPYVEAAKRRGEVRRDVDPEEAAEWLARMLMSVTAMQSSSVFDVRKPKSVGRFMSTYGVAGLLGER